MSHLQRLSRLAAALRVHLRSVWADDAAHAAGLDADLSRMEAELEALADDAMARALDRRTHCHCGAPMPARTASGRRSEAAETCGSYHCRAIAREAKHAIQRHHAAQEH